jgi:two-component system, sensor histidine kinase and response regulator
MNNKTSILIVDDETENFDVIEILLFKDAYKLHFVQSGNEALEFINIHQVDAILLDVMMPDLDGIEVCRQIKANSQWCYIPVVMVTALNSKEDLARCLEAGADDFISKPVTGVELRARVRSMLRIKKQYDALQTSLQLREDMANMIVHDFSNHLVSIVLGCEILRDSNINNTRREKQLGRMQNSATQLQSLTDSLLMLAKIESGKMLIQRAKVSLEEILESASESFENVAAYRKVQIIVDTADTDNKVYIDPQVIRRVIDNLLLNAIKFSPTDGQVVLRLDYPPNLQARIQVIDQGKGVTDELKQRIFDKFEVGDIVQGISQTGLGLAFCQLAIDAHEGRIFIEDNQPTGAIFIVEL